MEVRSLGVKKFILFTYKAQMYRVQNRHNSTSVVLKFHVGRALRKTCLKKHLRGARMKRNTDFPNISKHQHFHVAMCVCSSKSRLFWGAGLGWG